MRFSLPLLLLISSLCPRAEGGTSVSSRFLRSYDSQVKRIVLEGKDRRVCGEFLKMQGKSALNTTGQFRLFPPEGEEEGRFGHTTLRPAYFGDEFIRFATDPANELRGYRVDIGCGTGVTARAVAMGDGVKGDPFYRKATPIIAIDASEQNLKVMLGMTPQPARGRIKAWKAKFPELPFAPGSVAAVNMGSLLHFFSGDEIEHGLNQVYKWLEPGGKVFIETQTPYLEDFIMFRAQYLYRVYQRKLWPGEMEDVGKYCPARAKLKKLNLLDRETLAGVLEYLGFILEEYGYFYRDSYFANSGDGHELGHSGQIVAFPTYSVGAVARKPRIGEINTEYEIMAGPWYERRMRK